MLWQPCWGPRQAQILASAKIADWVAEIDTAGGRLEPEAIAHLLSQKDLVVLRSVSIDAEELRRPSARG